MAENAEQKGQEEKLRHVSPSYLRVTIYEDALHGEIAGDVDGSAAARIIFEHPGSFGHERLTAWLLHEYAGVLHRLETRLYRGEFHAPERAQA